MKIVLFSPIRERLEIDIRQSFELLCPGGEVETIHSIEGLAMRLMQPKDPGTVVLLFANSKKELSKLICLSKRLEGTKIILMLQDRDYETLHLAYQLAPRFITYADRGLDEVKAVLKQMGKKNFSASATSFNTSTKSNHRETAKQGSHKAPNH